MIPHSSPFFLALVFPRRTIVTTDRIAGSQHRQRQPRRRLGQPILRSIETFATARGLIGAFFSPLIFGPNWANSLFFTLVFGLVDPSQYPDIICKGESREAQESDEPRQSQSSSDVKHRNILASMTVLRSSANQQPACIKRSN